MQNLHPTWSRIGGVLVSLLLATSQVSPTLAFAAASTDKSETVHVQTDATGAVTSITVDELLANDKGAATLEDKSSLSDIEPSEDDQNFEDGSEGRLTWTTGGKQVSYKGTSSEKPPVDVLVSYTLDGVAKQPSELAGASGHLVIHIDYKNGSTTKRADHEVSTPFVCMTVALLDGNLFSNVQVENGKVVEDKGGLAVVGYALPGLKDSLELESKDNDLDLGVDLDFPEYLEISADVTDLTLDPIYTVVTPELFTDLDTEDLKLDLDDLDEGTEKLDEAMSQLIDGSGTLTDALRQLSSGSSQLGGGIKALREALGQLPSGFTALSTGMQGIATGISAASDGANKLAEGGAQLADGAQAALDAIDGSKAAVETAQGKVGDLQTALKGLGDTKAAIDSAADAAGKANAAVTEASETLNQMDADLAGQKEPVAGAVDEASSSLATTSANLGDASAALEEALAALDAISAEELTEEQQQAIESAKQATREKLEALNGSLAAAREGVNNTSGNLDTAKSGIDNISVAAPESLAADVATLDEAAKTLTGSGDKISGASGALGGADEAAGALQGASAYLDLAEQRNLPRRLTSLSPHRRRCSRASMR